jgi:hypothetical protein
MLTCLELLFCRGRRGIPKKRVSTTGITAGHISGYFHHKNMQENDMNLATRTKTLEGIVTYSLFVMKFSLYINLCDSS